MYNQRRYTNYSNNIRTKLLRLYHNNSNNYTIMKGHIGTISLCEQLKLTRIVDKTLLYTRIGALCLSKETAWIVYKFPYTGTTKVTRKYVE